MRAAASMTAAILAAAALAASACGGGGSKGDTTPGGGGGDGEAGAGEGGAGASGAGDEALVPPDTMDEIQRRFERRRSAVSRCLSAAIDAKDLPPRSRGRITLNVTVAPGGRASDVQIANATLESKVLADCVIDKVKEIEFPPVPRPYPTSYTYAFEAM